MTKMYQHTLQHSVTITGHGVHSNAQVTLCVHPRGIDEGILFKRTDVAGENTVIPASWHYVKETRFATILANEAGVSVSTVEHLLAALAALDIDNALVELSGPEVPILDGSAAPFIEALHKGGRLSQSSKRLYVRITRPLRVEGCKGSWASLAPADGLEMSITVDEGGRMARQHYETRSLKEVFMTQVALARTFGFLEDAQKLWDQGLAQGSSLDNTLVWSQEGRPLNPEGLRVADECARHKALDALGDLMLLTHPLRGRYESFNGGHYLNAQLVKTLMENPQHYELTEMSRLTPALTSTSALRSAP